MMRVKQSLVILTVGFILTTAQAVAHHAFSAEFDATKPISLRGTLVRMEWVNPHGWLHIEVKQPDGTVVKWMGETGAVNALVRRGWSKTSLKAGMEIKVDGYLAKDGTRKMTAMNVELPDGSKLFAGSSGTGAPEK
jgi:hypothetical protein